MGMGQAHYLTIRCPYGCEAWLQPSSFGRHHARCRGHQWVDDLPDSAVMPVSFVGVLASILPDGLVDEDHPEVRRNRRNEVGFDFRYGRRMRSPVEGRRRPDRSRRAGVVGLGAHPHLPHAPARVGGRQRALRRPQELPGPPGHRHAEGTALYRPLGAARAIGGGGGVGEDLRGRGARRPEERRDRRRRHGSHRAHAPRRISLAEAAAARHARRR